MSHGQQVALKKSAELRICYLSYAQPAGDRRAG